MVYSAFAFVGLLVTMCGLRHRQLSNEVSIRMEERLSERARIARELHDTLLQRLMSASMQFQVAAEFVPPESPAKPLLGRGLQIVGDAINEGRNAIMGLRSTDISDLNLEQAFSRIRHELDSRNPVTFHVTVRGRRLPFRPVLRQNRIGTVNQRKHSSDRADVLGIAASMFGYTRAT